MHSFKKSKLFERYPVLISNKEDLEKSLEILIDSFRLGGKLIVMGNGGSSADAEHFCGELVKGFVLRRELTEQFKLKYEDISPELSQNLQMGLPAMSLGVSHSLISAFSNDMSWDFVFAQQVHVFATQNDVVFGISTSGNSKNVVNAIGVARAKGVRSISLTGQKDSKCSELSDVCIRVPATATHEVQELHLPVYHALAMELEYHFYGK